MKKLFSFAVALLLATSQLAAQTDQNVTGNVNINNPYNSSYPYNSGVGNTAGNINLKGDVIFTGTTPWIFHTPNDASANGTALLIAPGAPTDWAKMTRFDASGDVLFSGSITCSKNLVCSQSFTCSQGASFAQTLTIGNVTSPGTLGINNLKLAVGGNIGARAIYVVAPTSPWPDYVFSDSHQLRPLAEVEEYVQANCHLPEVPSAAAVQAEGLDLGSMQATLLKKVEELTLYLIELKKENEALRARVSKLEH